MTPVQLARRLAAAWPMAVVRSPARAGEVGVIVELPGVADPIAVSRDESWWRWCRAARGETATAYATDGDAGGWCGESSPQVSPQIGVAIGAACGDRLGPVPPGAPDEHLWPEPEPVDWRDHYEPIGGWLAVHPRASVGDDCPVEAVREVLRVIAEARLAEVRAAMAALHDLAELRLTRSAGMEAIDAVGREHARLMTSLRVERERERLRADGWAEVDPLTWATYTGRRGTYLRVVRIDADGFSRRVHGQESAAKAAIRNDRRKSI